MRQEDEELGHQDRPRSRADGDGGEESDPAVSGEVHSEEGSSGGFSSPDPEEAETGAEAAEDLESELERLRSEVSELNDRHLRLAAEFDNYRRRSRAELNGSRARAQADLVGDFLEVLDDLERVRDVDEGATTVDALLEGVEMVERKFAKILEDTGVESIDPEGEAFDPESMEAMTTVPAESEEDDDRVHQVFQKGYRLDGHLIRPARVSVLKNA